MTTHEPMNIEPVEAIALKIEELIVGGQIPTADDDDDVLRECARRYVAIERAKRNRKSARNDPSLQKALEKTKAKRSENLRARIGSILDELAEEVRADGPPSRRRLETVVSALIGHPKAQPKRAER